MNRRSVGRVRESPPEGVKGFLGDIRRKSRRGGEERLLRP
jgi:hypothetical protein